MRQRYLQILLILFVTAAVLPVSAAESSNAVSILDRLNKPINAEVTKTQQGLRITSKDKQNEAKISTEEQFQVPLVITAHAKTDSDNIRFWYGDKGQLILNWEVRNDELKHRDPQTGTFVTVPKKGQVPKNTWVVIRWVIDKTEAKVEIDGVERARFKGNFDGISGSVGIGTYQANVTFKSLTVTPIGEGGEGEPIEISIPSAKVDAAAQKVSEALQGPPADQKAIERAEFRDTPKRLMRNMTSVKAMMVRIAEDGQANGFTSDIIATIPQQSRNASKAGIGFYRADGDDTMKTALEEAVRAVTLRYPVWEPGHIDLSFGEKYSTHGGPSAGTAFAVLMLSALEGFTVDSNCALTGDITVDWKVRTVGAVAAKLRGAMLDKCRYAAIPEGNATAFADMAVLYGTSCLWNVQVFSIATVQDAIAVVRTDRDPKLAQAIKEFAELQTQLRQNEQAALHNPQTIKALKNILDLAPNHLSAKFLLAVADGSASKTLSASATLYQLSVIFYPYRTLLNSGDPINRQSLPTYVTALARKRLAALRPIAEKKMQPLVADFSAFIEAIDGFASNNASKNTLMMRKQNLDARLSALNDDPDFMGKLVREGY